jgi:hypothetical protein
MSDEKKDWYLFSYSFQCVADDETDVDSDEEKVQTPARGYGDAYMWKPSTSLLTNKVIEHWRNVVVSDIKRVGGCHDVSVNVLNVIKLDGYGEAQLSPKTSKRKSKGGAHR